MSHIFDMDNPFNVTMTKLFDLVLVNLLWLLCCLPVITIGASTTALYYVTLKMVRGEETQITKAFFHSFKDNFRQSVPMTLTMLAVTAVLAADFHILRSGRSAGSGLMYGFTIVVALLAVMVFSYAWPLLSHFTNTVRGTFNNAWRMALTHLPSTLVILLVNCVPFVLFLVIPETFVRIIWIWAFVGAGVSALVNSIFLRRIFAEFE